MGPRPAGMVVVTMAARPAAAVAVAVAVVDVVVVAVAPPLDGRRTDGRRIAGITHMNTVTTVYKDGGEPEVYRTSLRLSTPNKV